MNKALLSSKNMCWCTPQDFFDKLFQSTHPGWGATKHDGQAEAAVQDFNPRTPGGVRPRSSIRKSKRTYFNPRTPGGVRLDLTADTVTAANFNPRTPGGVRPYDGNENEDNCQISIHAPRVGCDGMIIPRGISIADISIHAPRVGCDPVKIATARRMGVFQSTHPGWGATTSLLLL